MRCYILIGGLSRRMGESKQHLEFDGETFLARLQSVAIPVFEEVVLVARSRSTESSATRTIVDDDHDPVAPIFGIRRALVDAQARSDEKVWILAVDYPLLSSDALSFLRGTFEAMNVDICAPVVDGKPQTLCAGYSTGVMKPLDAMISAGNYALRKLVDSVRSYLIPEGELAARFDTRMLANVNTPEDYASLRRAHAEAHPRR
jgi:molybdopterin-guanine dinucleotide biosynthesis protein A